MRKTPLVAAAVAAFALGVAAADAAVKRGTFAGKTGEKDHVAFQVTKAHRVTHFRFEGVTLYCDDGTKPDTPSGEDAFDIPLEFEVSKRSRRFSIAVNDGRGTDIHARGRFNKKGTKAAGRLRVIALFDSETGNESARGDVVCKSHKLRWTAKRR